MTPAVLGVPAPSSSGLWIPPQSRTYLEVDRAEGLDDLDLLMFVSCSPVKPFSLRMF